MRARNTPAAPQHATDDALASLLAAERLLAERVAAAQTAAEETLRQAREEAQRIDDSCEATIESRSAALASEYESRNRSEIADLARSAQMTVARFEAADAARVRDLVEFVIERLLPTTPSERSQ